MNILHKYIIKESARPFLLALIVYSFVFLVGNLIKLMDMIINKSVAVVYALNSFYSYCQASWCLSSPWPY
jgi:lipopolysaccharide export LptBFGC system permease protein LptF